jgi:hypothetical protein
MTGKYNWTKRVQRKKEKELFRVMFVKSETVNIIFVRIRASSIYFFFKKKIKNNNNKEKNELI